MKQEKLMARRVARLLAACTLMLSVSACAQGASLVSGRQEVVDAVAQRYPSGAIANVETADRALADVDRERKLVDARYMQRQADCYPRFFTTACLDEARERHRAELEQLRSVEVEANAFKRKAKALERDRSLEARRAQDEAEAQRRALSVRPEPPKAVKSVESSGTPQNAAAPHTDREEQQRAKMEQERQQQAADAQKREENIRKYEKKVQDAQERQREVAARKAEKERVRAEKANSAASP